MLKLVFCVRRRPEISQADFSDYWLNQHGPLVKSKAKDLNMKKYVQSHTNNFELGNAISSKRNMKLDGFDGITEVWWDDVESLQSALGTEAGQAASLQLAEDEASFIDMEASTVFFTEEHEIFSFE
jgi:uncharacterized protein (TIGR02118 family)